MKKTTRLISLLLAAFLLTASLASCDWGVHPVPEDGFSSSSEPFTPHQFGADDAAAMGVRIGMTQEQVKKILGAPDEERDGTGDGFIYGTCIDYLYKGFSLSFFDVNEGNDLTLGTIVLHSPEVSFAGGLHVGSTKEDVLNAFTYEKEPEPLYFSTMEESCGDYIYGNINSSWFIEEKPTDEMYCAYINRYGEEYDNSYMMEYYYYPPLNWNADKSHCSGEYYGAIFYLDSETDIVTGIRIELGLSEY
ncbi:MAG: hypothetical protein IJM51_10265 [Clostridia bacterium]|nr:hypothetical protein [Clostridia bacterium]